MAKNNNLNLYYTKTYQIPEEDRGNNEIIVFNSGIDVAELLEVIKYDLSNPSSILLLTEIKKTDLRSKKFKMNAVSLFEGAKKLSKILKFVSFLPPCIFFESAVSLEIRNGLFFSEHRFFYFYMNNKKIINEILPKKNGNVKSDVFNFYKFFLNISLISKCKTCFYLKNELCPGAFEPTKSFN